MKKYAFHIFGDNVMQKNRHITYKYIKKKKKKKKKKESKMMPQRNIISR